MILKFQNRASCMYINYWLSRILAVKNLRVPNIHILKHPIARFLKSKHFKNGLSYKKSWKHFLKKQTLKVFQIKQIRFLLQCFLHTYIHTYILYCVPQRGFSTLIYMKW